MASSTRTEMILPPIAADPLFVEAVDEAISGLDLQALPDARPDRPVGHDPQDFASLYIRHRSSFELHVRRFLHDPRDVDDVVQEGFLRLFLALPELENELQALRFCRRVLTNLCIDRYRMSQRRPTVIDLDEDRVALTDESAEIDPVVAAEDAALVRQALALLSPLHRAVLVKREVEEESLAQIAAELHLPAENVKHILHRARQTMRRLLLAPMRGGSDGRAAPRGVGVLARVGGTVAVVVLLLVATLSLFPGASRPRAQRAAAPAGITQARPHSIGTYPAATKSYGSTGHRTGPTLTNVSTSPGTTQPTQPSGGSAGTGRSGSGGTTHQGGGSTHHGSGSGGVIATPPTVPNVPAPPVAPGCNPCELLSAVGAAQPTGPAEVTANLPVPSGNGTVTATSTFQAPTTLGSFSVSQTVQNAEGSGTAVATFTPTLQTASGTVTFALKNLSTTIIPETDGSVEVDATAQAVTSASNTGAPTLEAFDVTIVFSSGALSTIESETVMAPVTVPTSSSSGGSASHAAAGGLRSHDGLSVVPVKEVVSKGGE